MHHDDHHEKRGHHEPPRHHEDPHYEERGHHEPPRHHEDPHYEERGHHEPPRHHEEHVYHHTHHDLSFTVFRDRVEVADAHGHGGHETIPLHAIHSAETHGFFGRKVHLRLRSGHDREFDLGSGSDEAVHAIMRLIDHH